MGRMGLKLKGETQKGDQSGFSVSAAGDINSDGHADLLIGARAALGEWFVAMWCLVVQTLVAMEIFLYQF